MDLACSAKYAVRLSDGVGFSYRGGVSWGLDPFEDVDRADAEAYSIGYADVKVYSNFGAVDSELGRGLNCSPYFMFVVCFCAGEFDSEFRVDWQYSAPKVVYLLL